METLPVEEQLARVLLAFAVGIAIGIERERSSHTAGLRTHTLVCVAAAFFMLVSTYGFADVAGEESVSIDPSRVASYVAAGVGFIGAGAIISGRGGIQGLTTAATLWTVAALGLGAGAGLYVLTIASAVLILVILLPMKYLEERFLQGSGEKQLADGRDASPPDSTR